MPEAGRALPEAVAALEQEAADRHKPEGAERVPRVPPFVPAFLLSRFRHGIHIEYKILSRALIPRRIVDTVSWAVPSRQCNASPMDIVVINYTSKRATYAVTSWEKKARVVDTCHFAKKCFRFSIRNSPSFHRNPGTPYMSRFSPCASPNSLSTRIRHRAAPLFYSLLALFRE